MLERAARREIEREAEEHITLGMLLRREREEQKKLAVDKVLASDLTVAQKVERIRAIDAVEPEEDPGGLRRVVQRAADQATRQQISRILHNIKLPRADASYFAYLFRERRRLREFGRQTHVLETRLLPPGVRANPGLREFFAKYLQSWCAELSQRLALTHELGWLYLTKRQYNLTVLLKRLCDRMLAFDFVHLSYRDRNLIDKLRRIEALFLALSYRPGYVEDILSAVRTVAKKQGQSEEEYGAAADLVVRLLSPEVTLPSLYNCLLGLNMVQQRRFLTFRELMRTGLSDAVSTEQFDCDPQVSKRIEEYVGSTTETVKKLHQRLFEVRRLNGFLRYGEHGEVDTSRLRGLYHMPGRGKQSFAADQENVVGFSARLFRLFDRCFSPLLNGQVMLDEAGRVMIFSRSFFQLEFSKLRTLLERLERGAFNFTRFPFDRYLQVKEGKLGTVGAEGEAAQLIDDGIAILVDLGKSLSRVLSMNGLGTAGIRPQKGPLEPVVLQGKPFVIPHQEKHIQARTILGGMTVGAALNEAVTVCFTAGVYFHDRFIFFFLGREQKISAELQTRMRTLGNLLDPDSFRELSRLYS